MEKKSVYINGIERILGGEERSITLNVSKNTKIIFNKREKERIMEARDVSINGIGTILGGEYENVKIDGMGTINGGVVAKRITINGKAKTTGKIQGEIININGYFTSNDSITVGSSLVIDGYYKGEGDIEGNELIVNGRAVSNKNINVEEIKVNGELISKGDCQCGNVIVDGRVNVSGLLSGDNIEIKLGYENKVNEIGGEKLVVKRGLSRLNPIIALFTGKPKLTCRAIEVEDIYLEETECKVVRGTNVVIGPGCKIHRIEYSGELSIDKKSEVKETIKL